jgi:hypothetical protein
MTEVKETLEEVVMYLYIIDNLYLIDRAISFALIGEQHEARHAISGLSVPCFSV